MIQARPERQSRPRPEEFKKLFHGFRRAFPDIHFNVQETVSEDDLVVAYCRITATHKGEAFGMLATGKLIAFEGMRKFCVRGGRWWRFGTALTF